MRYSQLSQEGKELYCYMTTNPEPMKILEHAYRKSEQLRAKGTLGGHDVARGNAVLQCAQLYSTAFSSGHDANEIFNDKVQLDVRQVLKADFHAEILAGNSWLTGE